MPRRLAATLLAAVMAALVLVTPALAGGWAASTLEPTPGHFEVGRPYQVAFTIRLHGVTPIRVEQLGGAQASIRLRSVDGGEWLSYPARPEGPVGRYVAEVRFPSVGGWVWEIVQGPFAPQPLGSLTVLAAPAPAPAPALAAPEPARLAPWAPSLALVAVAAAAALAASALTLGALARAHRERLADASD